MADPWLEEKEREGKKLKKESEREEMQHDIEMQKIEEKRKRK